MDENAREKTPNEVFEELRGDLYNLAKRIMNGERVEHTLQPTALLSETWIKLFSGKISLAVADRSAILATAAMAMRNILIDHARRKVTDKRGGGLKRVPLDDVMDRCEANGLDASDVMDALNALCQAHPRQGTAMSLRFIGRFKIQEIAAQMNVTPQTIASYIKMATAWLHRRLGRDVPLE